MEVASLTLPNCEMWRVWGPRPRVLALSRRSSAILGAASATGSGTTTRALQGATVRSWREVQRLQQWDCRHALQQSAAFGSSTPGGQSAPKDSPPKGTDTEAASEGADGASDFVRAAKEKAEKGGISSADFRDRAEQWWANFRVGLGEAWRDLIGERSKEKSSVVRKLRRPKPAQEGGEQEETGQAEAPQTSGALMVVKSAGEAWEALQARLREAPIIQDILAGTKAIGKQTGATKVAKRAREAVGDKVEDAREAWETSQHPIVYQASSMWDSIAGETEMGAALRELRRLDPWFNAEDWKVDITDHLLPDLMGSWLRGEAKVLSDWMSEAVHNKLVAEITQRKKEGLVIDPHILSIDNVEIVAIKADADSRNPTIVIQFMCQQINCIRNLEGEVVQGSEDDIQANYYMLAFRRDLEETAHELRWRVVDFMLVGNFPYL